MSLKVDVQLASECADVPDATRIRRWAKRAMGERAGSAELSVRVVDEEEGARLNAAFRGREGATNVLSFPFDAPERTDPPLLGDVVICAPVVRREAEAAGADAESRFALMVVHGTLHLLGYDHQSEAEAESMQRIESALMIGLGFSDPYRESAV